VDDVELVRHALRTILSAYPLSQLWAKPGEEALGWCPMMRSLSGGDGHSDARLNGIQATALIKRFFPHVIVVGLSVHAAEDLRQEMITAGATSVLTKDHAGARLHQEITKAVDCRSAMLS
jgi:DNA-binding NarL/FixJ family response regulator